MPEPSRAPRLLDQLQQQNRYLHYSLRTEQCYVQVGAVLLPRRRWRSLQPQVGRGVHAWAGRADAECRFPNSRSAAAAGQLTMAASRSWCW
jgi:hypothetical protein